MYITHVAVKYAVVLTEMAVGLCAGDRSSKEVFPTNSLLHILFFLDVSVCYLLLLLLLLRAKESIVPYLFKKTRLLSAKFIKFLVKGFVRV